MSKRSSNGAPGVFCGIDRPLVSFRYLRSILGYSKEDLQRLADSVGRFYRPFDLRRNPGTGKWRHIDNPVGELKRVQQRIHGRILRSLEFPPEFCGGLVGRNAQQGAQAHIGSPVLVCMDLKNCFPSISPENVYSAFSVELKSSTEIASLLTRIATFENRLPQGAPTSPVLANLVLLPMYQQITEIAARYECAVSYFVDDIAISGYRARQSMSEIIETITSHGFAIACRKTCVLPQHVRQENLGIVVNKKSSISREVRSGIRERIFELADSEDVSEADLMSLRGKINHVLSVNYQQGASLMSLFRRRLPEHGIGGPAAKRHEVRKCNDYSRDHSGVD